MIKSKIKYGLLSVLATATLLACSNFIVEPKPKDDKKIVDKTTIVY